VVRTRPLAQALVESGHVRLNGTRMRASGHGLKIGDVLTIALEGRVRVLVVQDFAERRGSAEAARALYEDQSPAPPPRAPF
jgi:ribosome-associated heat shock protein Hsp15